MEIGGDTDLSKDLVGKVIHYYDRLGVAVVKLEKKLKVGDEVKFAKGEDSFNQVIESMQLEHAPINEGKAGSEVAIKVNQKAKDGTLVYSA